MRGADALEPLVERLAEEARGTVMFVGASDTGKTTLARAIYEKLESRGRRVAYLDCDVGQSTVGPPATIGVRLADGGNRRRRSLFFVGNISPRGHFLPMVVGAHKLRSLGVQLGCSTILVDTTGMVDPRRGGTALKLWKVELLQPDRIVALQREGELEELLSCLRYRYGGSMEVLPVPEQARLRGRGERYLRRQRLWRRHFDGAPEVIFPLSRWDVWDSHLLRRNRLLGFDGHRGLCLGLGVVLSCGEGQLRVKTPCRSLDRVCRVRVSGLSLDPDTGQELVQPPERPL